MALSSVEPSASHELWCYRRVMHQLSSEPCYRDWWAVSDEEALGPFDTLEDAQRAVALRVLEADCT